MPGKTPSAATADLVPFAWAGLILNVPPTFRLFKIDGNARKGMVGLADDERSRLELAWGMPRRKRFKADAVLRRKIIGTMPHRSRRSAATDHRCCSGAAVLIVGDRFGNSSC